jgi:hypothetical protein
MSNQTNSKYQPGWERVNFQSSNHCAWPNFATDKNIDNVFIETPNRSYADKTDDPSKLHKNAISCGYKPINNVSFAFPSLLYPAEIVRNYTGFIEVNVDENTIYKTSITPFSTGSIGWKGLGQVGETICVDPILSYSDENETYFLMGMKKLTNKKLHFICGGGMMEPNLDIYENMYKELKEEALGSKDVLWLKDAIKNGNFVYVGYLISPRNTDDRYHTTVAYHISLTKQQALSLNLISDPNEDCTDPHWFPYSKVDEDENIPPSHRAFLHLSMKDKVRYCQFPNPFWGRKQLKRFRSVMNNVSKGKINEKWAWADFDEKVYFVLAPDNYDRIKLWETTESVTKSQTNIVIVDPFNSELAKKNKLWLNSLIRWHLHHSRITQVFVMPENCETDSVFDYMYEVQGKENIILFIHRNIESKAKNQIPKMMLDKIVTYESNIDIAKYLIKINEK